MNITQIANHIDKKNWAFTVYKTKPEFKELVKFAYQKEDTAAFLANLITESGAEEIQILPFKKNGNSHTSGIAKIVTINLKDNMNNNSSQSQNSGLNGNGFGLGFNEMLDLRDLKRDKESSTEKITELKAELETIKKDKAALEIQNRELLSAKANAEKEKELDLKLAKLENKNPLDKLFENPQLMATLVTAFKKPAPSLTGAAPQLEEGQEQDPKVKFITDHLSDQNTPGEVVDLVAYVVKAHKSDNTNALKEVAEVLVSNKVIATQNPE